MYIWFAKATDVIVRFENNGTNEKNIDDVKNLLLKSGYKLGINKSKMIYTIGPFADISHAKEESSKLNKVLGIDNKISSFVF